LGAYRRTAKKSLGQHFLRDGNVVAAILREASLGSGDRVVELGAGDGALTVPLSGTGARLVAVELDPRLVSELRERLRDRPRAKVLQADITRLDYRDLLSEPDGTRAVVLGNLPYNRASHVLLQLADVADLLSFGLFMVQKEVAERIVAAPGGKDYGALTVLLGRRFDARRVLKVAPGCFRPPPRVESAVVRLTPRENPFSSREEELLFRRIVRFTFQERRKTLRNTLIKFFGLGPETQSAIEVEAGIDLGRRPETLERDEFLALAGCLRRRGSA
jgi:16S rRNA (adenine1518-N6/adenine1519-N6)-dimethyltransferase